MHLMIQNKGVAPIESYTLLGASSSRGVEGAIGQFGTGNKQAINVLLRAGLKVRIYCGNDRLDFNTRADVFDGTEVDRVTLAQNGRKPKDLGWVLGFGELDWTEVSMGLREFVANALDNVHKSGSQNPLDNGDLIVDTVADTELRAKAGYTRVCVEVNADVTRFNAELPKRFLHFSDTPLNQCVLPKAGRSVSGTNKAMIYREGVFIREMKKESIFDYNLRADEIDLDDCRNSSEYAVRASIARRLVKSDEYILVEIFKSLSTHENTLEASLDSYYLNTCQTATDEHKANWSNAWQRAFGDAVLTDTAQRTCEYVCRKGYTAKPIVSDDWREAMIKFGITSHHDVLSGSERKGCIPRDTSAGAQKALNVAWEWVEAAGLTCGKEKPRVACFKDITDAETELMGYHEDGVIYLREDICTEANKYTYRIALEEIVHYVTGSADLTRDFQNFLFDLIVEYLI